MSSFGRYCKPAIAAERNSVTDEQAFEKVLKQIAATGIRMSNDKVKKQDELSEAIIAAAMRKVRWWRFPKILAEAGNGWEVKRVHCCQAGLYFKENYKMIFILPDMKIGNLANSRWRPYRGFPPFVEEQK